MDLVKEKNYDDFSLGTDSEKDDDATDRYTGRKVTQGYINVKSAAIHALGFFA